MCRLIEIPSALDPRFSSFESQKALLLLKKNIFRPPFFLFIVSQFSPSLTKSWNESVTFRTLPSSTLVYVSAVMSMEIRV